MRIIGQSGLIDIPYDKKCIGVTEDGYIIATDSVCVRQDVLSHSVIAEYSSKEIALDVMEMIRDLYTLGSKTVRLPREEEI